MSKYEGLFIFPESLKDDSLESAIDKVKGEIERQDGSVDNVARMGRKPFARPILKQNSGHYVVLNMEIDGTRIQELHARLRLNEEVIRAQFLKLAEASSAPTARSAAAAESSGAAGETADDEESD